MTASARLSVLAALAAALALPIGAAAEPFDEDPEITVGDADHGRDDITMNGNNLTINEDILFELSGATQCEDIVRTAVESEVENTTITINRNASLTIDNSACEGGSGVLVGIAVFNGSDDPESPATARLNINGDISMPTAFDRAIFISDDMGETTINIGPDATVQGSLLIGQGGDHSLTNDGTIEGFVLFTPGADPMEPSVAQQTLVNNGTIEAVGVSNAIEVDDNTYTKTIPDAEEDPADENNEDTITLSRDYQLTVTNNGLIDGNVYLGASGAHVFRNNSVDEDVEDTVLNGMVGTVIFGGGETAPFESVGGAYQNFGTHIAGDDGIAIFVSEDRDPVTVLGGYDEELNRHTIEGVDITNAFGGTIWGNIVIEGADSNGFTNQGTLMGRVMFDGLGENLVTLRSGTIYRPDGDESNIELINTGDGSDRVILSGTVLSPNEIVEPEEGEEPEDTPTVSMTLIDLGDGDDFATLSSGGLIGAETALDAGAGDDHITITPSGTAALAIEGEISGGENDGDSDTLEINGGTTGLVTEVTGEQKYTDFENFRVTSGEVHLNLTAAVAAQEATEEMEAVEGMDATQLEVEGGELFIGEGAVLRLGLMGSLPTEGESADFIRHFSSVDGLNEGTLVFDTKTEILAADNPALFTNAGTGTLGFAVVAETDEDTGIASVLSQGAFYDSSSDDSMDRLVLEAGSSIGLVLDHLTLATDLDPNSDFFRNELGMGEERDLFSELQFDVIYTPAGIVRTITPGDAEGDPDTEEDVDIVDGFDLEAAGINLVRDNPFYAFAFDVNEEEGGPTVISIIASRKPAFAFSLRQMGKDPGAGALLDRIFEETLNYDCATTEDPSEIASCEIDADIRELAKLGFGAYGPGVRGFEPNRHSGLWEGMLNNHKMTLGVVSLRSATYRADAGGISPAMTQYAALPSYSTAADVLSVAGQQSGITGVNAGSIWETNRFWIQGFGGLTDRETSATDAGHQTANGGVVLGYDRRIGRTQMFGLFASYGVADIESSNIDQEEVKIDTYAGGVYYATFSRTASAEISFSGGGSNIEGDRMPFLGGGTASYDTSGWHLALRGAADTNAKAGRFVFTPNAAFQYTFMRQGEYDETGTSPSLLSVDGINMHSIETTLGVNVGLPIRMGRLAALPKLKLSWQHEFLDDTGDVDATLINVPSAGSFSAAAVEVPADRFTTGLGFDLASRGGTTFTIGYDFTLGDEFQAHGGAATLRLPF